MNDNCNCNGLSVCKFCHPEYPTFQLKKCFNCNKILEFSDTYYGFDKRFRCRECNKRY